MPNLKKNNKEKVLGVVLAIAIIKKLETNKSKRDRCIWCREWLLRRYMDKDLTHIAVKELQLEDPESFINFCRLSKQSFEELLHLVGPRICKQNTTMRESISATTKLLITLRFFATGNTYKDLSFGFRVSVSSISLLVPETAKAIYLSLRSKYLQGCKSASDWKLTADNFYHKWNFPMCLGAIDGKHVAFRAKSVDGSYYYNYKGFNSIILLAVVDANYKFIMVDVGTNGRSNDAAAFNASDIGDSIKQNSLHFPENEELPGTTLKVPYVFISDDAFRLSPRILKPYSQRQLQENKIFNCRLSRARRVVENAFGILSSRFQIFQREINLSVEKVELVTLACCVLHNFLCREGEEEPVWEALNFVKLEKSSGNRTSEEASEIRNNFREFFNTINILPWQNEAVNKFNF